MKNNKNKKSKIELLAPAGDFRSLAAAVKAGADAVYFGLKDFNMRDNARNFSVSDLKEIRAICNSGDYEKEKKVRMYLTLNTIIFDEELGKMEKTIKSIKGKVDAVICWDLAVVSLLKKYGIPVHISTQASVANSKAAEFYRKLGAERVVLARELNLKQIKKISGVVDVEVFAHGALCVSESGRCFTSQFLHCKSANRGMCKQSCRKSYIVKDEDGNELKVENSRIFSAKDLCTLPFIEKLKKAGIRAIKIEGRNREPEYVYSVVSVYRRALDRKFGKKEIDEGIAELEKVYNREFSSGFYLGVPTSDDFTNKDSGSATETKKFVATVKHYWKNIGVARVFVNADKLSVGDEIIVSGKTTFLRTKIEDMEINHVKVKEAKKGEEVALKIPLCREGDEVYLVVKRD